jgi:hypothetical protein
MDFMAQWNGQVSDFPVIRPERFNGLFQATIPEGISVFESPVPLDRSDSGSSKPTGPRQQRENTSIFTFCADLRRAEA